MNDQGTGRGWVQLVCQSRFVNPAAVRGHLPETIPVSADGTVVLFGDAYRPAIPLTPGTAVGVRRDPRGFLLVRPVDELRREAEVLQAAADAAREQQRLEQARLDRENQDFNERLNVPARWLPDANPYLVTDWYGKPRRTAPAYHVRLVDDLDEGRLRRRAGEYLCAAANRTTWADLFAITDRNGDRSIRVSCRACLAITRRWTGSETEPVAGGHG